MARPSPLTLAAVTVLALSLAGCMRPPSREVAVQPQQPVVQEVVPAPEEALPALPPAPAPVIRPQSPHKLAPGVIPEGVTRGPVL